MQVRSDRDAACGAAPDASGATLAGEQIHVRIHDLRWGVFHAGQEAPESVHDRKIDAVAAARDLAAAHDLELVVFSLDGRPQ
jgi:hypothetical protein